MGQVAGKAVCFAYARTEEFRDIQEATVDNAAALAGSLADAGFRLVSGGTDNHLVLVDLRPKGLTGDRAEEALEAVGILCNRNPIPFDPAPIRQTSGIRIGTPGVSLRGIRRPEILEIGSLIREVLEDIDDASVAARVTDRVADLCRRFPLPGSSAA